MTTEAKTRMFARFTALCGVLVLMGQAATDYPWFF